MKVTIFLTFFCTFPLFASTGKAQNAVIELPSNAVTVETLFSEIEKQTDYLVVYSNRELNVKNIVTLSKKKAKVSDILKELLKSSNLKYEHTNNYIVFSKKNDETNVTQQTKKKVTGTVMDKNGEAIIGASVLEKGTTNGTITDIDGRFSPEVGAKATLAISYIGYVDQNITIGNKSMVSIILQEDSQTLEEVVVIGYGTQKKVNLTGSVGTVDSEALASRPVQNAVQALQGVVPGLQITTTSGALDNKMSMSIRGTGTIGDGSDASPLVLIDGMEGDINSINPQDIENISILKDAAAASIYGSRAPFGVILVTTKSGKSGKTTINYNNNFRWGQPVRIPKQMDSYTFATFYNDANINSGAGAYFNAEHLQRIKDYQDGKITDGVLADANNKYWLDGYAGGNANTDWYDVIYREWTSSQEHNLSFSGGNDKVNYYISGNFMDQKGLMEFNQDTYKLSLIHI